MPAPGADTLVSALTGRGQTIATAESLTGGRLCAALVDVPGASAAVRGAVVAYASAVKTGPLGVDPSIVDQHGAVSAETARAMAERARAVLGADWGVATTGVAGPDPAEGRSPGTAYVAVAGPERVVDRRLMLAGDRDAVRAGTVRAAVVLALEEVTGPAT